MEESKRLITSWVRITHWLSENFPEALENLYSPAFDSQIETAEATIGLRFPDALKTLLREHNGEDHHWPPGIFPNGHRFLPTEDIVETWYQLRDFHDATPEHWLPFSASRSKAIRFLDFNPPQGGNVGQVVEVNFDQQTYDVVADSFVDYIEKYAMELGVNKYAVIGDDILLHNDVLANDESNNETLINESIDDALINAEVANEDIFDEELFDFDLLDAVLAETKLLNQNFHNEAAIKDSVENRVNHPIESNIEINVENTFDTNTENNIENIVQAIAQREAQSTTKPTAAKPEIQEDVNASAEIDVAVTNAQQRKTESTTKQTATKTEIQDEVQASTEIDVAVANALRKAQNATKQTATKPEAQDYAQTSDEIDVPVLESAVQPIAKEAVKKPVKVAARQKTQQPAKQSVKQAETQPARQKAKAKPVKPVAQQAHKSVAQKPAKAQEPTPNAATHDRFESGERLIIVGEMTSLMGKEEMLFTVETEHAKEYTFLAKGSFTKGFSDIALDQYVRVLAKKFHGEIKSHFIEQGLAKQPEYVAFDYVVLPVEKPSDNKVNLPPPENLDEIAHSILQSIQNNFRRRTDFKEIKLEQITNMRSRFYNESTEKLLKLGFHYTADLLDQASVKGASNNPPYFRVMSFFDDGIVASFYHIKPKFTWPFQAARKVIEFETELSDGNIIISTTAEDEIEYPLPKTINRYVYPNIPLEGLLHKHRSMIRRYQTRKPDAAIVKVRSKKEFVAFRQRRQQMTYNHLKSVGWVTKEYVAKQFNNKEVAEQVYARIKRFAGTKV